MRIDNTLVTSALDANDYLTGYCSTIYTINLVVVRGAVVVSSLSKMPIASEIMMPSFSPSEFDISCQDFLESPPPLYRVTSATTSITQLAAWVPELVVEEVVDGAGPSLTASVKSILMTSPTRSLRSPARTLSFDPIPPSFSETYSHEEYARAFDVDATNTELSPDTENIHDPKAVKTSLAKLYLANMEAKHAEMASECAASLNGVRLHGCCISLGEAPG